MIWTEYAIKKATIKFLSLEKAPLYSRIRGALNTGCEAQGIQEFSDETAEKLVNIIIENERIIKQLNIENEKLKKDAKEIKRYIMSGSSRPNFMVLMGTYKNLRSILSQKMYDEQLENEEN